MKSLPAQSVFLGRDWLLYTGTPGDFNRSEMISPGLISGRPETGFSISIDGFPRLDAPILVHRSGFWGDGKGASVAVLYFDALSIEGLAIQNYTSAKCPCIPWQIPDSHLAATNDVFKQLDISQETVFNYVAACRKLIRERLTCHVETNTRLQQVANIIANDPSGRLDLSQLSHVVGISSDHLRQQFKLVTGMTLSRYQMWHRLRLMASQACFDYVKAGIVDANNIIHGAGFFDTSHGGRAIRRYFGLAASSVEDKFVRYLDCRALTC